MRRRQILATDSSNGSGIRGTREPGGVRGAGRSSVSDVRVSRRSS